MNQSLFRKAVSLPRRGFDAVGGALPWIDSVVAAERPDDPLHCLRPATIAGAARVFAAAFPGAVLYAVKCNPEPRVLRALWRAGVRHFDCASPAEIALVRQMFPAAHVHYMHPVKSRAAIGEALFRHGVRDFVFDSADELAKIVEVAGAAAPRRKRGGGNNDALGLIVRLAVPNTGAEYALTGKFGAPLEEAAALLAAARSHATRLGVCFHVGSQCLAPGAYRDAIRLAGEAAIRAGVKVDILDVGGGFPVAYSETTPPALALYTAEIAAAAAETAPFAGGVRLWAEPGRALVAAGTSIVARIVLRRGGDLYINDGIYGSLSDAGTPGFRFPARLIRHDNRPAGKQNAPFRLFGPTCDSADRMDGPFVLPADAAEGDWIEIGQIGAYGAALRTAFNGFDRARLIEVADPPLLSTPGYEACRLAPGAGTKTMRVARRRSRPTAAATASR